MVIFMDMFFCKPHDPSEMKTKFHLGRIEAKIGFNWAGATKMMEYWIWKAENETFYKICSFGYLCL